MAVKSCQGWLCAIVSVAMLTSGAYALETVLIVDLSVVDQITISATDGLSDVTTSGSDTTGVYFENFYGGAGGSLSSTLVSGDLTSAANTPDGSPLLYRGSGDPGLNFWSWTDDATVTFTAGAQAFAGSATWTVDSAMYAEMLAGNSSGNLYFPADTADDIASAELIGTFTVIPEPGTMALLGLVIGFGMLRSRR